MKKFKKKPRRRERVLKKVRNENYEKIKMKTLKKAFRRKRFRRKNYENSKSENEK